MNLSGRKLVILAVKTNLNARSRCPAAGSEETPKLANFDRLCLGTNPVYRFGNRNVIKQTPVPQWHRSLSVLPIPRVLLSVGESTRIHHLPAPIRLQA